MSTGDSSQDGLTGGHPLWVRLCHWALAAGILILAYSGVVILMAHPRLYWGDAGNDLTRAWVELPLGPNYHHAGWGQIIPIDQGVGGHISRVRVDEIFNKNGWARSLHFLMAWLLVTAFLIYGLAGLVTGHVWRDLAPRPSELAPRALGQDILAHLRLPVRRAPGGPPYGVLQKSAYFLVVAVAVPVMILSGMAMSPAIDAAYPLLPTVFVGAQSARSIHFLVLCLLALFLAAHLIMVAVSGFWRQMRAMTWGR